LFGLGSSRLGRTRDEAQAMTLHTSPRVDFSTVSALYYQLFAICSHDRPKFTQLYRSQL
jgi:hypothetical protein